MFQILEVKNKESAMFQMANVPVTPVFWGSAL